MAGYGHDTVKPLPVDPVQMIAIDLDGTLLRSDNTIGLASIDAIRSACARGVRVVLATARPPRGVSAFYTQLGLDTLQINHNGALIYDQGRREAIRHLPLEGELARKVVKTARRIAPKISICVDVVDTLYTDRKDADLPLSGADVQSATGSLDRVLDQPVTKIFMSDKSNVLADIQMSVQQRLSGRVAFTTSHMRLLQIVRGGVDKSVALAEVAKHYCVDAPGIMAIGDAPNDLGMLKWAGLAVAVKNAWSDVLKAAHFVVPSNDEDGVAEAIQRYVLI